MQFTFSRVTGGWFTSAGDSLVCDQEEGNVEEHSPRSPQGWSRMRRIKGVNMDTFTHNL